MNIIFKSIILHNFLSFGHSEINLEDKKYCLVSGINKCSKDNAVSNGSGKSTIWSGICWALTGETIQGITSGIKNINIDKNECYVELKFIVNKDTYIIKRVKEPKVDLKITINGEDKSGKGIRESEAVLSRLIPDINKDLLSSVILLGQGLPNKLSAHTPSGRKELLEKLSKSDFMIEDIKKRISERQTTLNEMLRKCEDNLLANNSRLNVYTQQLDDLKYERDNLKEVDINEINTLTNEIEAITNKLDTLSSDIGSKKQVYEEVSAQLKQEVDNRQKELDEDYDAYASAKEDAQNKKIEVKCKLNTLEIKLKEIESIQDVCPTCGRPFEGIVKPDTSEIVKSIKETKEALGDIDDRLSSIEEIHWGYIEGINDEYSEIIDELVAKQKDIEKSIEECEEQIKTLNDSKSSKQIKLIQAQSLYENYKTNLENLSKKIDDVKKSIDSINNSIDEYNKTYEDINHHLDVVKKMETLVKRDFRGYLLSNVISFIDRKCKEYCVDVFGTNALDFVLDGNNIDILYCGKNYELLSGGEKQKVDIVLQFALRDMMSTYLNFSCNIIVLDEIFDNLDTIGTDNVISLINNKLNDIESVFIISHHSDSLNIPYDNEIVVIKNEEGISEVR